MEMHGLHAFPDIDSCYRVADIDLLPKQAEKWTSVSEVRSRQAVPIAIESKSEDDTKI